MVAEASTRAAPAAKKRLVARQTNRQAVVAGVEVAAFVVPRAWWSMAARRPARPRTAVRDLPAHSGLALPGPV
jgi:hypothetical protein